MYNIKKRNNLWFAFLFMVLSVLFPLASPAQTVDWTISTIDSTGDVVGFSNSIAVDSNNKVHIGYVYSDRNNNSLKYATNASGDWITSTIDSGDVGWHTSIAVDSSNHVHISYYTATEHDLKYATNASGDWVASTIDSGHQMGIDETHIAVDSNNKVHICYHGSLDLIGGTLKYITNASRDWVTSTIDSGDAGLYSSIAIDSKNKVHVSYLAGTDGTLKYATNALGHWGTSTIDSKKGVGWDTSIAIDSNNKVHISYFDSTNIALKYATNASGHWVKSKIDSSDGVGSTSIAIDSNNKVHISYYDYGNQDLKYATNAQGAWVTSIIDSTGDVGNFCSIAVDSNNKVHISYYDSTNHDLKYAETSTSCPLLVAPTPTSPVNGATGISTTTTLDWSSVSGATTYSVQVCSDSACNNVVTSTSALTNSRWTVSPSLNNKTQYWWRTNAGNSCGNSSQWSGTSSFTTNTRHWTPKISVAPMSVNLGSVRVGGTSNAKTVTIKNTGKEDLVINSITITGANQSEFNQTNNCSIVSPKSSCFVTVTFVPEIPFGKKSGIMSISSSDPKKSSVNVKLKGKGI